MSYSKLDMLAIRRERTLYGQRGEIMGQYQDMGVRRIRDDATPPRFVDMATHDTIAAYNQYEHQRKAGKRNAKSAGYGRYQTIAMWLRDKGYTGATAETVQERLLTAKRLGLLDAYLPTFDSE